MSGVDETKLTMLPGVNGELGNDLPIKDLVLGPKAGDSSSSSRGSSKPPVDRPVESPIAESAFHCMPPA